MIFKNKILKLWYSNLIKVWNISTIWYPIFPKYRIIYFEDRILTCPLLISMNLKRKLKNKH